MKLYITKNKSIDLSTEQMWARKSETFAGVPNPILHFIARSSVPRFVGPILTLQRTAIVTPDLQVSPHSTYEQREWCNHLQQKFQARLEFFLRIKHFLNI